MASDPHLDQAPTTFILCRHGESQWNVTGRIQGQSEQAGGLTDRGRRQAERLAARLRTAGVDLLYSSDSRRAVETADTVGHALGLRLRLDRRWREVDLGHWEGLTGEEVQARWPEEWAAFRQGRSEAVGDGETYAQVLERVLAAMRDLADRNPGRTIAVVSHGGPIRVCITAAQGRVLAEMRELAKPILNTSVTIVTLDGERLKLLALADTGHLEGEEATERAQ